MHKHKNEIEIHKYMYKIKNAALPIKYNCARRSKLPAHTHTHVFPTFAVVLPVSNGRRHSIIFLVMIHSFIRRRHLRHRTIRNPSRDDRTLHSWSSRRHDDEPYHHQHRHDRPSRGG